MVQYGQTKSVNCLTSVMPVNTDVSKVTCIFFFIKTFGVNKYFFDKICGANK